LIKRYQPRQGIVRNRPDRQQQKILAQSIQQGFSFPPFFASYAYGDAR